MIFHLLTLIFIILKVAGIIAWSWWLVLLPSILVSLVFLGVVLFSLWFVTKVANK